MVDQNLLFNKDTRMFAFDDSPFSRGSELTSLIGIIMRKDFYIESIVSKKIRVDGLDVTEKILESIEEKGSGVKIVMVQGATFGGFNILDINRLFDGTGIPIVNVIDHQPDMAAIRNALEKHFQDWQDRYSLFVEEFTQFEDLFVQSIGVEPRIAYKFLRQMTINGNVPEPLRIADMIAGIC